MSKNKCHKKEILRPRDLCEMLSISIPTLYRWLANGDIPIKRVRFGPRAVGFKRSDVDAWLNGELENKTDDVK